MKNILKKAFLFSLAFVTLSSCVDDDETAIPTIREVLYLEDFESTTTGSGSVEVPISIEGWANYAVQGSRKWHARTFSGSKYAEFSSFYSVASTDPNDEIWLVTPAIDLSSTSNEVFSFTSKIRFHEGDVLTVFISENYDGTEEGIATATWTELDVIIPTAAQEDLYISSGNVDISSYNSTNVRIAFKYTGSKQTGVTTTHQIDNIKIFENN